MACGVPIIGSDMCAIKDYVINGINGFKFIPKNEEDMANKIEELFNTNITELKKNCVEISKEFLDINVRSELKNILDI
jgi:glycosyltransferase involved in cell wall biosynthesis